MSWLLRITTFATVLAIAAALIAFQYARREALQPFKGYAEPETFFTVAPGDTSRAIARGLESAGIVKDARLFLLALQIRRATGKLQAGEYRFAHPESVLGVIDRLVSGDVFYITVTVPEGLTLAETADLLERKELGSSAAFLEVFKDKSLAASFDSEAQDLEGYLFPDTYRFPNDPDPMEITRTMVQRFRSIFDDHRRERAAEIDLTVREVVTLASVVEKETGVASERPVIASVFWNRLERRMPLQSDPTVIYGLKRRGGFDGNLRRKHLRTKTSYNTYTFRGLPPGPIASPGRQAIDATLHPAETKYLYFVSRNDGTHQFSTSLKEHNAAVRKYQVEYFRERRRKGQSTS